MQPIVLQKFVLVFLISCPTGALVHAYRERLPPTDQIVVETLHSGFSIARKVDLDTYSPPGRLRRYDLISSMRHPRLGMLFSIVL